ncbi:MAG: phage tail tape measure protein, partial [Nanoarchaeota archaeon]
MTLGSFVDPLGTIGSRGVGTGTAAARLETFRKLQVETAAFQKSLQGLGATEREVSIITRDWQMANKSNIASFDGMTASIGKAIAKVTFWMMATTAVIGTLQKVGEVTQLWKDLEITLERIGITTSTWGDSLYKYFETTADVARRMGMPIEQTLKGMDLALRATARYEDEIQRTAVATIMLRDAAILGNVAGMQFEQAIDILVGSLRQTGMELHEGTVLLDKWVAVAKNAAVSVNDLSQGFAIMSSAAASAGLNIDQVNGLISALSESVTLGPVEVGNAIRALMATLYNPGSIATLGRFGVAVADATGEFRSFWDIMNELSSMVLTGALDENQILQIAKAAGAGQRRYAQFIALLKNWVAAVRASEISANAQGEALEANERIVNTLTNAWDQFTAAQNKFWYALGQGSGIIEELTSTLQTMAGVGAWMADWNDSLFRILKTLAQITVALLVMKVAMVGLAKVGLVSWAGGMLKSAGAGVAALAGVGALRMAPGGGAPGYFGEMGPYGPYYMRGTPPSSATAAGAWGRLGRGITRPWGAGGAAMGGLATGMIAREISGSDWVGVGAGIGGGVGAILGGPVGLAIGGTIGGVIAHFIEDATKPFEQKMEEERQAWLSGLDPGLKQAMEIATRNLSLEGFTLPIITGDKDAEKIKKVEEALKDVNEVISDLNKQAEHYRDLIGAPLPKLGEPGWMFIPSETRIVVWGWEEKLNEIEKAIAVKQQELKQLSLGANVYLEPSIKVVTLDQELAESAKKIREEYNLQVMAQDRLNVLKGKSIELSVTEFETQRDILGAFPVGYSNLLAQVRRFLPEISAEFEKLFTPEEYLARAPEAFDPLRGVLGSLKYAVDQSSELDKNLSALEKLRILPVPKEEFTVENVKEVLDKYKQFVVELQKGTQEEALLSMAKAWGIVTANVTKLSDEQRETAVSNLDSVISTLNTAYEALFGKDLWENAAVAAKNVAESYVEYAKNWKAPGQIEFITQGDTSQIEGLLEKYKAMLGDYLTSVAQTYHVFLKDEEGIATGFLQTFKDVQPEVWQAAMLEYTKSIAKNTEGLEAEYNLPSGYAKPSRYWYYRTTGSTEFGPQQQGLWAMWQDFVKTQS